MADWKYILAASDTMETIQELKLADNRTISFDNNKSGQLGCDYHIEAPNAGLVVPWATCIIAQRDVESLWSGPVTGYTGSLASGKMTINAVGWFERLMHILIQAKVTFVDQDAGQIAAALLQLARDQDSRLQITMGINESTQTRTITYDIDANIGQEIMNLAELESGYDWYIDPLLRTLNIVERRGIDRPDCKWVYIQKDGSPARGNCKDIQPSVDGTTVVNEIRPRGQLASGFADDADSKYEYGLFQEAPSLSDVVDTNILIAYANAEMVYRAQPRVKYAITPKASSDETADVNFPVPVFGDDFDIGDITYMTAQRGFINEVDLPTRAFGVGLSLDPVETITTLTTSADGG